MKKQTDSYPINQELKFYQPDGTPLVVQAIDLKLNQKEQVIQDLCLLVTVNYQLYELILQNSLFNLNSEVIFPLKNTEFGESLPIDLEIQLRPDLLAKLPEKWENSAEIINGLVNLEFQPNLTEVLNITENWYCLAVKQQQESGKVECRTLWDYLNLSQINEVVSTGNEIVTSLSNFMEEATESLALKLENSRSNQEGSSENIIDFLQLLQQLNGTDSEEKQAISEVMKEFFDREDWNFVELENEAVLQMAFQGENGRWTCYACSFEEAQQFVFYSVYPLAVPSEKVSQIIEYLTKVNYGLIIGNFELDYSDYEIRYKTSIDVENEQLTLGLIENLVYANVLSMDKYLPGISSIINHELSPDEAIAIVENPPETQREQEENYL